MKAQEMSSDELVQKCKDLHYAAFNINDEKARCDLDEFEQELSRRNVLPPRFLKTRPQ